MLLGRVDIQLKIPLDTSMGRSQGLVQVIRPDSSQPGLILPLAMTQDLSSISQNKARWRAGMVAAHQRLGSWEEYSQASC